MLSSLPVYV
uniref:Uncharacterized protein n=1 Tax=Anguilla anguilla TaxID=7936 RepID=A0A0E9UTI8_ANGAN